MDDPWDEATQALIAALAAEAPVNLPVDPLDIEIAEQAAAQQAAEVRELLGDVPELTPEEMAAIEAEIAELAALLPPDLDG